MRLIFLACRLVGWTSRITGFRLANKHFKLNRILNFLLGDERFPAIISLYVGFFFSFFLLLNSAITGNFSLKIQFEGATHLRSFLSFSFFIREED